MPTLAQSRSKVAPRSARSRWLKLLLAVVAAVLLNVAFFFLVVWVLPYWPRKKIQPRGPIVLTISPSAPTPPPEPAGPDDNGKPRQPEYMRTIDRQNSETPPPDPNFISDKNTLAASEKPPEDPSKPLPSSDGKEMPFFDFDTTPYRAGKEAADSQTSAVSAPDQAPPGPSPSKERRPDQKKPDPNSKAKPTPRPNAAEPTPTPGDLRTLRAESTPATEPPVPQESPTPDANSSPPPPAVRPTSRQPVSPIQPNSVVSSTGVPKPPGYQPQTVQTRMKGGVDNRGRSAVSALGTPLGRYEKAVSDSIGMLWNYSMEQQMSDIVDSDSVKLHFFVTRSGHVRDIQVTGRKPNSALSSISYQSVSEAQIPPIPPEVISLLPEGELEVDYTFTFSLTTQ